MINKYAEIAYRLRLIKAANFMLKQALMDFSGVSTPSDEVLMMDEFAKGNPEGARKLQQMEARATNAQRGFENERRYKANPKGTDKLRYGQENPLSAARDNAANAQRQYLAAQQEIKQLRNSGRISAAQAAALQSELNSKIKIQSGQISVLRDMLRDQTSVANNYSKDIDRLMGEVEKGNLTNRNLQYNLDKATKKWKGAEEHVRDFALKNKDLTRSNKYLTRGLIGTGAGALALSVPAAYGAYHYFNN